MYLYCVIYYRWLGHWWLPPYPRRSLTQDSSPNISSTHVFFIRLNNLPVFDWRAVYHFIHAHPHLENSLTRKNVHYITSEAYPSCTVTDIRFCFDVHKLMRLDLERYGGFYGLEHHSFWSYGSCLRTLSFFRRKAMKGRLYFATKAQKEGKIMIKTHPCAQIFCCDVCGFEKVRFVHILLCTVAT